MPELLANLPDTQVAPATARGAAADRTALGRVAKHVVVAAIAFLLTAGVWELVIDRLHARPAVPEPFKSKIDLCLNTPGVDTIFIGSSRYFHGIDPARFDQRTTQLGLATHSFNLGFDALDFPELRFVVQQVLDDPRSHGLKYLLVEPSLRVRLAPGLEHSQRAITLHDAPGSQAVAELILKGNHDWKRKLFWLYEQGSVSVLRLTNVGALTNAYVRPQEPRPDANELAGPAGDGYSGLDANVMLGPRTSAPDIARMISDQKDQQNAGTARSLNGFEIEQLTGLQRLAAGHDVKLILLAPPTAAADIFGEFSAVSRGESGVPVLSFADPVAYFDLYNPDGFVDPDHISKPVAEKFSVKAADGFAELVRHVAASPASPASKARQKGDGAATESSDPLGGHR